MLSPQVNRKKPYKICHILCSILFATLGSDFKPPEIFMLYFTLT